MTQPITRELFWLTLTVILTGLLWIPYIINRCQVRGLTGAMANPSRNDKPHADWANRLMFAHDNAVENLVIFAPLVLILNAIDYSDKWTVMACAVYFWSRVAHLIVYTLGLPVFRTLAFTVGFCDAKGLSTGQGPEHRPRGGSHRCRGRRKGRGVGHPRPPPGARGRLCGPGGDAAHAATWPTRTLRPSARSARRWRRRGAAGPPAR